MMKWPGWFKRTPKKTPTPTTQPPDVVIVRGPSSVEGTFGELRGRGFSCKTVELPDRGNAPNLSCVLVGTYDCRPYKSNRFGQVYLVDGVKGRSYILTHSGNLAGDKLRGLRTHSAGCILLGKYFGSLHGQKAVMCSRPAVRQFKQVMGDKPFTLEIKEVN